MATKKNTTYLNNPELKAAGVSIAFEKYQLDDYLRCMNDPIYFIRKYVKTVHVDKGTVPLDLYDYQERIINAYHTNRKTIVLAPRQMGKTVCSWGYLLHQVIFNPDKKIAVLANKAAVARKILAELKYAYEKLPLWLQQGVLEWNKGSILLENNSSILASATSANAIRGSACAIIYLDEIAFIPKNIAEDFLTSVFPVISSGKTTKIIISSTPKGMNIFYKMWTEAEQGVNGFTPVRVYWDEHPDRDQHWLEDQKKNLGPIKTAQEIFCSFLGSDFGLITGEVLARLTTTPPVYTKDCLKVYLEPSKGHSYVGVVDTSRGQHLDFSAVSIIDITQKPYQVACTFKDNTISPNAFPYLVYQMCKKYNDAYALIEVNDLGEQISNSLFYEFEYENVYFTFKDELTEGRGYPGVRTTKKVKSIGCSTLKDLIEGDQLIINSSEIFEELTRFVQKGASYAAEDTSINDDLCTTLWLFAWLTKQKIFSELTDTNIRAILAKKTENYIDEQMLPVGLFYDGRDEDDEDSVELDISRYSGESSDPFANWVNS